MWALRSSPCPRAATAGGKGAHPIVLTKATEKAETLIYQWVPPGRDLAVPGTLNAFRCLIILARPVSDETRYSVSETLVKSGCLFAIAFGPQSTLWDDSIDHANLAQFDYGPVPAGSDVMTSWHDNESLEETLAFAKFCSTTAYDGRPLTTLLILDFSDHDRATEIKALYAGAS